MLKYLNLVVRSLLLKNNSALFTVRNMRIICMQIANEDKKAYKYLEERKIYRLDQKPRRCGTILHV